MRMRSLVITNQITKREPLLDMYFAEVGRYELVSSDEEVELAVRIRMGDEKALEKLATANLRFVISVAKQYQNQGLELKDLINEGNYGLLIAAQRFDETRGFKFISYATWWIRQSILLALAEQSRMVKVPMNVHSARAKTDRLKEKYLQLHDRVPNSIEISEELNLSEVTIERAIVSDKHVSFDKNFKEDVDNSMLDVIVNEDSPSPERSSINESLKFEVENMLHTLSEKEANVIRMSFGINCRQMTANEIAKELGFVASYIELIKRKTLNKIKNSFRGRILKSYAY